MKVTAITTTAFALLAFAACKKPTNQQNSPPESMPAPQPAPKVESAASANFPPQLPTPTKKVEDMTALEVAQNPTVYGFEKISEMNNGTMSGREAYNADLTMVVGMNKQWVKKNADGKTLILTVHYDNDKPTVARWGGY